jgi:hypothetical protein
MRFPKKTIATARSAFPTLQILPAADHAPQTINIFEHKQEMVA